MLVPTLPPSLVPLPSLFLSLCTNHKMVNEESLKVLNSYLDSLHSCQSPRPVQLQFYLQSEHNHIHDISAKCMYVCMYQE